MLSTRVLALLALHVGLAHSFSWDIVVGAKERLEFFYNGTLTHAEDILDRHDAITSIAYDPVQYRILFAYQNFSNMTISIFDLATRKAQHIFTKKSIYIHLAYDPVTELLFWSEGFNMYSLSLKNASFEKTVDGNLLRTLNHSCHGIAVDSCRGYIYWLTDHEIERVRFDGSAREVLINSTVYYRTSLAIDQQTQKMYWFECDHIMKDGYDENDYYVDYDDHTSVESADLNGDNRKTLYKSSETDATIISSLAVSKDFIYVGYFNKLASWKFPKNQTQDVKLKLYSISKSTCWYCLSIAANYTIQEQTKGTNSCEALKTLDREATHGFTAERCNVSICHYYCFQGDCSITAEGQPICRCKDGYSGNRCEVNACQEYCLNSGVCSLNEEDEPVCQCTDDFEGKRCDVPVFLNTFSHNVSEWRDMQM